MFEDLKKLVSLRLGSKLVSADLTVGEEYFLRIDSSYLTTVTFFLKHDPDTHLALLDQIIILEKGMLPWPRIEKETYDYDVIYQLKSIRLPYRVNIVTPVDKNKAPLLSIASLFNGAAWHEQEISEKYGLVFE